MLIKSLFISVGEPSGDMHGGYLLRELKYRQPDLKVNAIGGDRMAAAGARILYHIRETSFMGFAEVVKHIPFILRLWRNVLRSIRSDRPDAIVLIDYPGFNLRLARAADCWGIPVIYYISPQVWAWHQKRVDKIRKYVREVICILPFEPEWFRQQGIKANFVGHPLLDQIRAEDLGDLQVDTIREDTYPVVGLFPGSRRQEVERHLPVMLAAVRLLREDFPGIRVLVGLAPGFDPANLSRNFAEDWVWFVRDQNHQIMQRADFLIVSSGTASLEATIIHTPLVVIYKLSALSYWLGRRMIKVPFIAIANLIAGRQGIPELIQSEATAQNIYQEACEILLDPSSRRTMIRFQEKVTAQLGAPGASRRAADIILKYLP